MATTEEILKAARPGIEAFEAKYAESLQKNIAKVFLSEALPALKDAYVETYDRLAAIVEALYPPAIRGKDPLSLVLQRGLFVAQLEKQIAAATFEGGELSISLKLTGETDAEGRPTTPDSLNYYIEGVIGEYAYITPEHLLKRRPTSEASRGRLGQGFIISRRNYERERWKELTGVGFPEVRHPVSGFSPFKDFDKVPESVDFAGFVAKALENTNAEFDGQAL